MSKNFALFVMLLILDQFRVFWVAQSSLTLSYVVKSFHMFLVMTKSKIYSNLYLQHSVYWLHKICINTFNINSDMRTQLHRACWLICAETLVLVQILKYFLRKYWGFPHLSLRLLSGPVKVSFEILFFWTDHIESFGVVWIHLSDLEIVRLFHFKINS